MLEYVKSKLNPRESLGWSETARGKTADFKYCCGRYSKLISRLGITKAIAGVTGHGARAQYAENAAILAGVVPPTLGGTVGQMSADELYVKRSQISQQLGHNRVDITSSYYGSFVKKANIEKIISTKATIEFALKRLSNLVQISEDRLSDCVQLVRELSHHGVDATPQQVQAIWALHSERFGKSWVTLHDNNIAALEAAALRLLGDHDLSGPVADF